MHSDLAFSVLMASASGTFSWSVSARKGLRSWGGTAAKTLLASSTATWNSPLISLRVKCVYTIRRTPKHTENQRHKYHHLLQNGSFLVCQATRASAASAWGSQKVMSRAR
jgi:hypothetical protein